MVGRMLAISMALAASTAAAGSIQDVEHIIIYMQENRAFDHYYGTLQGVRGFHDRAAPTLPSGKSPFHQPTTTDPTKAADEYQVPYPLMFNSTSASCMSAPEMDYPCDIKMWNNGKMDGWNTQRSPGYGMSYFNRSDLPYYYALADAFTIGDQYFQSTFTATNPNRHHLFAGSNGLSVNSSFCMLDDGEPDGIAWETFAETLEKSNVSWRLYQEQDNFDDNGFAWYDNFKNAKPGDVLYDKGMYRSKDVVEQFRTDVSSGKLPQVSYIVGPAALSEHASHHPADGEDLSARLIKVLQDNPKVYANTALILNYDEGGQFYDHHWAPTPPISDEDGKSTVIVEGELTKKPPYSGVAAGLPIGPGFRVPMMVISPWSRGGYVYSEVTDHISVLKFVEQRFGVRCPNISPWRRAVMGDLTAAFDFENPDFTWPVFPNTSADVNQSEWQCENLPSPEVPATQVTPVQEKGTRKSRALPYEFDISDIVNKAHATVQLKMSNTGKAGAVFHVFDLLTPSNNPKKYTIEAGKALSDVWSTAATSGKYSLSLHGPNGFVRQFAGDASADPAGLASDLVFEPAEGSVKVGLTGTDCTFTITDNAYGVAPWQSIYPTEKTWTLQDSHLWYDLSIKASCASSFHRRFMGRMENGMEGISDPAMAVPQNSDDVHPPMPDAFRHFTNRKPQKCQQPHPYGGRAKDTCEGYDGPDKDKIFVV